MENVKFASLHTRRLSRRGLDRVYRMKGGHYGKMASRNMQVKSTRLHYPAFCEQPVYAIDTLREKNTAWFSIFPL